MIADNHLWGESWTIYRDKRVWVVGFRGKKGGESSLHYHTGMANHFFICSGRLRLEVTSDIETPTQWWPLSKGESFYVKAHSFESHRLVFVEDTEGIETYYALPGHEIDEHDIVRLSPGRAPDVEQATR